MDHPSKYPWSSYGRNALGQADENVIAHREYLNLGRQAEERQRAYRGLFKTHIPEKTLKAIRDSTNRAWVLGSSEFKAKIEAQLGRRSGPLSRGGDRKSAVYREKGKIDRV